ncbi:MAG: hypothetical protein IPM45_16040 [Acidimicrobiales bacterium]|nr:hypothetical protein [Acidimicrobiales bacterium]
MPLRFRDRFFTPPVARAMTSPSGILLAGVGAAVVIATGLPLLLAPVVGAAAWAARVAASVPRAAKRERVDPFALADPWRRFVQEALQARARFDQATRTIAAGPLRERLTGIGDRIQDGVDECWRIATRGQALDEALAQLDVTSITRELAAVEHDASSGAEGSSIERTAEALRAQLSSAERMTRVATDARDRLRLLDARLDEAVARAIELSVGTGDDESLGGLGSDVDSIVGELEALRQALEETGGTPALGV